MRDGVSAYDWLRSVAELVVARIGQLSAERPGCLGSHIKSDVIAEVLEVVKLVDGNSNAQQPLHFLWPSASERRNPLPFLKQTLVRTRCKKK